MKRLFQRARAVYLRTISRLRRRGSDGSGKRVLVHDILSIQIFSAALIGGLAIATLYWGGQWVLQDNYGRWALQWTEQLNELGSPLYLSDDNEALIRLESFVRRYPEIETVTYFSTDGTVLFSVGSDPESEPPAPLKESMLTAATDVVGTEKPYLMESGVLDPRRFEILAPVWTESIADDGLFAFDPDSPQDETRTELVGFVGIHLDFMMFHDNLLANIKTAVLVLIVLLIAFAWYGRRTLQNALESISELEHPIRELARGNLGVKFKPAEHREISDIVEALETTASALSERDAELLQLANHDSLTGLYNRHRFVEELRHELQEVMRTRRTSALLFVDLDQFKYVNDSCGHPAGDRLICKVADELLRSVGDQAIVARFGGDEFAILCPGADQQSARETADMLIENMRRMAHIEEGRVFHVHCSIGVTMVRDTTQHHDELIGQADFACREAKSAGRNRYHFFDDAQRLEEAVSADVGWMNRLRKAIDEDLFELRFQPINRIDTGVTSHHEVLIRVPGADGTLVSPDVFLPVAVRFGLMSEIDTWVLRAAAKAFAHYSADYPDLRFSINLSANAFESESLHSVAASAFELHEVPPERIILEITESLAIRRPHPVERQIAALQALGCEIALDDFGTGYSSFSYLQKLNVDYLKIDGAFIEDILESPVDQKMVRLIAEIGHDAGMQVIAEYVQSAEALALLGELGVDLAQGYFVGKPARQPRFASTPIALALRRRRQGSEHG